MSKYDNEEVKRLSKFLIPVNIVVAIICLIAAISIILAPIITVDVGAAMQAVMETADDNTQNSPESSSDETTVLTTALTGAMVDGLDFKISVSAWNINELSSSENPSAYIIKTILIDSGLIENGVLAVFNFGLISAATQNSLGEIIREQVENSVGGSDLTSEDQETLTKLTTGILAEIYSQFDLVKMGKIILSFQNTDKDTVISNYVNEVKAQASNVQLTYSKYDYTITIAKNSIEVDESLIDSSLAPVYDYGTDEGTKTFSMERAVCSLFRLVFENSSESGSSAQIPEFESYSELITYFTDPNSGAKDNEVLKDLAVGISNLNEQISQGTQYMSYTFYGFLGFAGLWGILFLFAVIHIFLKNKRFTMWYVKLLGWIPGIIFVAITALGPILKATLSASEAAKVVPILACLSSGMWIPMACYCALWLVSIFWAFPIKHKVRKALKNA
ncbi:MAG: hypothetical protein ACI4L9_02290 [Candidatus Coproplasma sp.]